MKACEACCVHVETEGSFCPLCGGALEAAAPSPCEAVLPENGYPDLSGEAAQHNLIRRVFIFFSVLGGVLCLLINLLVPTGFWWSLIVIAAVVYCWLSIPPLLRRGVNYGARVVFQTIFTSALMVVLDGITGYRGWSLSYAVPGLLSAGIMAIGVMVVFNRTNWAQYLMYQVMMGIFGLVPLVLYLFGLAGNLVMVIIAAGLALASLLTTIVFGDRSIKSEFKRRFHM